MSLTAAFTALQGVPLSALVVFLGLLAVVMLHLLTRKSYRLTARLGDGRTFEIAPAATPANRDEA